MLFFCTSSVVFTFSHIFTYDQSLSMQYAQIVHSDMALRDHLESPVKHVFGLWEDAGVHREKPNTQEEIMQTPHGKTPAGN